MSEITRIYDKLDLRHGNLAVTAIDLDKWGSVITIHCLYRYPPEEKIFRLIFHNCRGIEWLVQKRAEEMDLEQSAQLMTHDLGQPGYERTARFATTLVELLVSYETMAIEKDW